MRKRGIFRIITAAVIVGTAMMFPELRKNGLTAYGAIAWLAETVAQFLTGMLLYSNIKKHRYKIQNKCRVYRFYGITDWQEALFLSLIGCFYLFQSCVFVFGQSGIKSALSLSCFYIMILNALLLIFIESDSFYISDKAVWVSTLRKEYKWQEIKNYEIKNAGKYNSALIIETEEKSYRVTASDNMLEGFQKAFGGGGQLKVF